MLESRIMLKIIDHRKKKDINLLQEVVKEVPINELIADIKRNIADPTFILFWDSFMQGFDSTSDELCSKYSDIICATLEELKNAQISIAHNKNIISILVIILTKFPTKNLIKFVSYCIQLIQAGHRENLSWVQLFPELLNIMSTRDVVHFNENTYTGAEYKMTVIDALCILEWSPNILISMATMFIDASLTKEEHLKVVSKLLQNIESLTATEIPSFVHSTLKFCKHLHSKYVFFKLQNYFHLRIYSLKPSDSSDMNSLDLIDVAPEPSSLEAEANILFHIHQEALLNYGTIKDYLNCLKTLVNVPEFVLHPFQIVVLLTISKISHYEELALDIIKRTMTNLYKEGLKRNDSIWFSENTPQNESHIEVFERIMHFYTEGKQVFIKQGLITLAFLFMSVSPAFGNERIAQKHWQLGRKILLDVLKKNRNVSNYIIRTLCNYILTKEQSNQYIDFLRALCRHQAMVMMENHNTLIELLESFIQISNKKGVDVLEAIGILTRVSTVIKDKLILILRKALFSRSVEARNIAVSGFLQILSNVKIRSPSALNLSDSSGSSGQSLLTQISASRSGINRGDVLTGESLCLEILLILRRCFMQQGDVKVHLYKGLCNVVSVNSVLSVPILEFLMPHFMTYYQCDTTVPLPFNYTEIIVGKDSDPALSEPLGKMLQLICYLITKANLNEDDNAATKFVTILNGICNKMLNCNLSDYGLGDSLDFTSTSPTTVENYLILREAMIIYNVLISYKINTWTVNSTNYAKDVETLHNNYYMLLKYGKNAKKNKKSDKRNKDKSTSITSDNTSLINKCCNYELPIIEYHPNELIKILQLLYFNEVNWAALEERNILKSNTEFHQCVLQATNNYVDSLKERYDQQDATFKKLHLNNLEKIGSILYNDCINNFKNMIEFDMESSHLILESFYNILQFNIGKSNDIVSFICNICDNAENDLNVNLTKMIELFISLYEDNNVEDDADTKKLNYYYLNILSLLSSKISHSNTVLSTKVMDWLKNYCKSISITNKQTVASLSGLMLKLNVKFKKTTSLYENIGKNFANVYGTINITHDDTEEFLLINNSTINIIMPILCKSLKSMLDNFDWLMSRMKAEVTCLMYENSENFDRKNDKLKQKERNVSCQMCWLINIMNVLADLQITDQTDHLIKNLADIFVTLNTMTKYFIIRSTKEDLIFEEAKFDKVIKLAGKQLSRTVYNLILFLDENQIPKSNDSGTQSKRKNSPIESKILKATKHIPKLIFDMEQFSKSVIQLSKKANYDLTKYVGQGTSRDFRILNVEDILKNVQDVSLDVTTSDDQTTNMSTDITTPSETDDVTDAEESTNLKRKRMRLN